MSTQIRPIARAADAEERKARLDIYRAAVRRGEPIAYQRGRMVYGQEPARPVVEERDE